MSRKRRIHGRGYVQVLSPEHSRANRDGYVLEHLLVVERALGRVVPMRCDVHHVNEVPGDNTPSNLVLCEDRAYHMLLHRRAEAFRATGNPSLRRCWRCGQYGDVEEDNMYVPPKGRGGVFHRECRNRALRRAAARERMENGVASQEGAEAEEVGA